MRVSFDGDFTDNHPDTARFVRFPFEAQMFSGPGQLKTAGWQGGSGLGVNCVILLAVRVVTPCARRQDFHFAIHDFHGDGARSFGAEQLSFTHK